MGKYTQESTKIKKGEYGTAEAPLKATTNARQSLDLNNLQSHCTANSAATGIYFTFIQYRA